MVKVRLVINAKTLLEAEKRAINLTEYKNTGIGLLFLCIYIY